jgi:hypothetical protein
MKTKFKKKCLKQCFKLRRGLFVSGVFIRGRKKKVNHEADLIRLNQFTGIFQIQKLPPDILKLIFSFVIVRLLIVLVTSKSNFVSITRSLHKVEKTDRIYASVLKD